MLHPRDMAIFASASLCFAGLMLFADRIIAGAVQCSALGCLPHGVAL